MIAGTHAKAIRAMDGGTLHSVFNHRPEGARKLADAHGIRAFSSMDEFLADPELDIVTVCTPSGAHFEPAHAAIRAGKLTPEKRADLQRLIRDRLDRANERHNTRAAATAWLASPNTNTRLPVAVALSQSLQAVSTWLVAAANSSVRM